MAVVYTVLYVSDKFQEVGYSVPTGQGIVVIRNKR